MTSTGSVTEPTVHQGSAGEAGFGELFEALVASIEQAIRGKSEVVAQRSPACSQKATC
ncbi:MAG: hypothetical protein M5U19_16310 [Microthrixaceae bacterium]|nr:hypothetical protein [Microthrixaceae bacterium]